MGWLNKLFGGGGETDEETETDEAAAGGETDRRECVELDPPDDPWVTVLYPLEFDAARLEELLEEAEVAYDEIEVGHDGLFRVVLPEMVLLLEQRDEPYDRERMDRRYLPETFPDDHAYLSIEPQISDPLEKRDMLREPDAYPDPWGDASGTMRLLTRLVRQLLSLDGIALVLERGGGLTTPGQEFVEVTASADEGDWQAVLGWLDTRYDDEEAYLGTHGFHLFGLPDLAVRYEFADGGWRTEREWEAIAYASARMLRENRVLGADPAGDALFGVDDTMELRVPLGLELDDPPADLDPDADFVPYTVELDEEDRRLVLTADAPATVWETWAAIDEPETSITPAAYRVLFRHAYREMLGERLQSFTVDDIPEMEPLDCDHCQTEQGPPAHFVPNGHGLRARTAGDDESRHLELAARVSEPGEPIIDILANCAAGVEMSDESWAAGDILEFEEPLYNLQVFALSPLFEAEPDEGPPIAVWQLVPMTEEEFEATDGDNAAGWLDEHDGATTREFAERWRAALG